MAALNGQVEVSISPGHSSPLLAPVPLGVQIVCWRFRWRDNETRPIERQRLRSPLSRRCPSVVAAFLPCRRLAARSPFGIVEPADDSDASFHIRSVCKPKKNARQTFANFTLSANPFAALTPPMPSNLHPKQRTWTAVPIANLHAEHGQQQATSL